MSESKIIKLTEYAGGPICVTPNDGEKAYLDICAAIDSGQGVSVSFSGVEDLTPAFLNAAIGHLYGKYSEEILRERLTTAEAKQEDLSMLKRVVDRAKEYFRDPLRSDNAVKQALGEDDE